VTVRVRIATSGRATARRFAAEGATVVGCDRDEATLARTVTLVRSDGYDMTGLRGDDEKKQCQRQKTGKPNKEIRTERR